MKAVNKVADYDEYTQTYKIPYNALALGTIIRKCGIILQTEYIISNERTKKESCEDFMTVFNAKYGVYVNKNVVETLKNRERESERKQ